MNKILPILLLLITTIGCGDRGGKKNPAHQTITESISATKPIYNVYVENSASMDGYVKGVTEFETAIYNYLIDIKIADLTDSLNLYYINSQKILHGRDISDFIEKLEPTTFRERGGNRGTTDISDVFKMVLNETQDDNISILISDFIFSPGRGLDAEQYLNNQQIGIKSNMAEHLKKHPNHAVLIYQLASQFNGIYYNRNDKPCGFSGLRPYYIWIIGKSVLLSELSNKCNADRFKGGGVKNTLAITNDRHPIKYAIQYGSGNFRLDKKDTQKSIVNAQKDTKGVGEKKMRFNVNVDFSNLLMSDAHLLDATSYDVSDKDYILDVQKSSKDGYSHILKLSTTIVKPSLISIKVKSSVPSWVNETNDDIGDNIKDPSQASKTFGFKYLVGGIYEAFTKDGAYCADIKINVNQNN